MFASYRVGYSVLCTNVQGADQTQPVAFSVIRHPERGLSTRKEVSDLQRALAARLGGHSKESRTPKMIAAKSDALVFTCMHACEGNREKYKNNNK